MEKEYPTQKDERLYHREDPNSDRWARSIRAFLGTKHNVDILSKAENSPENFHPLRVKAKSTMQAFRPIETTNAAAFLLHGIGNSNDVKQIKAAQFLFAHLDLMKMDREGIKNAFLSAVTEKTPPENIEAIIQTGMIVAPDIIHTDTKRAVHGALNHLDKSLSGRLRRNHQERKPQ